MAWSTIEKRAESSTIRFANNPTQTFTFTTTTKRSTKRTTTRKSSTSTTKSSVAILSATTVTSSPVTLSPSATISSSVVTTQKSTTEIPTHPTSSIAASPSSTSLPDTSSPGISGGAIAGIIIGVLVLMGALVALLITRRRKNKQKALASPSDPFTVGFSNNHPPVMQQYQPQLQPMEPEGLGVYTVAATYTPTLSDEIDIQVGDKVQLLAEYDDGWCQGMNITQNTKGVFPKHCLDYNTQAPGVKRLSSMHT